MSDKHQWYHLIAEQDRVVVDAAAEWLRPVPWQWFVTLTFPWDVRSETADARLKQWLDIIERSLRTRVCFVAGKERNPRHLGMEVPWHFHLLVTSMVDLPKELLEDNWRRLVSYTTRHRKDDGPIGGSLAAEHVLQAVDHKNDSAVVESYSDNRLGPEYCLKSINNCSGDWTFRWIELFNPKIKQTNCPSHSKVRTRARFAAQRAEIGRASMTVSGITQGLPPRAGQHG